MTKEPELYYTKQGVAYARVCVAVNRVFRNSLGEQQVDFINCVIISPLFSMYIIVFFIQSIININVKV
ncbi:TPA: single-stranded DNA-binding protein [Bacillus cereus]|uniref:single-stranded DNA-binding protein n=1 Tax=Bacillus cereus group TaxID=86661 RepID=UPI00235149C3|nr:single-stranded DNA-binding protein [Bacillus cereus]